MKKRPRAPARIQGAGDGDGQMGLAGPGAADQHGIALMGEEVAGGEVAYQGLVDRGVVEHEVVDVAGERQLGNGDLVFNRAGLLLADLSVKALAPVACISDTVGRLAVVTAGEVVVLAAQLHACDVLEAHHGAVAGRLEQDLAKLLGGLQPALRGHRGVELLASGGRQPTQGLVHISIGCMNSLIKYAKLRELQRKDAKI